MRSQRVRRDLVTEQEAHQRSPRPWKNSPENEIKRRHREPLVAAPGLRSLLPQKVPRTQEHWPDCRVVVVGSMRAPSPKQCPLCPPYSGHCFHITLQAQPLRFSHCHLTSSLLNPKLYHQSRTEARIGSLSPTEPGLAWPPAWAWLTTLALPQLGPPARTKATRQPMGRGRRKTRSLGHGLGKYPLWDSLLDPGCKNKGPTPG